MFLFCSCCCGFCHLCVCVWICVLLLCIMWSRCPVYVESHSGGVSSCISSCHAGLRPPLCHVVSCSGVMCSCMSFMSCEVGFFMGSCLLHHVLWSCHLLHVMWSCRLPCVSRGAATFFLSWSCCLPRVWSCHLPHVELPPSSCHVELQSSVLLSLWSHFLSCLLHDIWNHILVMLSCFLLLCVSYKSQESFSVMLSPLPLCKVTFS